MYVEVFYLKILEYRDKYSLVGMNFLKLVFAVLSVSKRQACPIVKILLTFIEGISCENKILKVKIFCNGLIMTPI